MGIGLRVIAEKIGVTPNTISRLENGSDPKVSTANAVRQFYETNGVSFTQDGDVLSVNIDPSKQSAFKSANPEKAEA